MGNAQFNLDDLFTKGQNANKNGERSLAESFFRVGLSLARENNDSSLRQEFAFSLGTTLRVQGKLDEASEAFAEAMEMATERQDQDMRVRIIEQQLHVLTAQGATPEAILPLRAVHVDEARKLERKGPLVDALTNYGTTLTHVEEQKNGGISYRFNDAETAFKQARDLIPTLTETEDPLGKTVWFNLRYAEFLRLAGRRDAETGKASFDYFNDALKIAKNTFNDSAIEAIQQAMAQNPYASEHDQVMHTALGNSGSR